VELSDWDKREKVTITNAGDQLTNYYIRLDVSYEPIMNSDFSDLRFTSSTGTILDYWIATKEDGVEANVWVEIPTLNATSDTEIYMYKGNSLATTTSTQPFGTEENPALGCNELYRKMQNAPSNNYFLDPDEDDLNIKEVYCDMNEETESGWVLVHNYEHFGGTNPTVAPSSNFPVMPYGVMTISDIVSRGDNGELVHVDNISQYGFSGVNAVRLYGATTSHSRILHYYTINATVINSIQNVSIAGNTDLRSDVTHLSDHTANLPDAARSHTQSDTNHIFGYKFPMYLGGTYHWATAGSGNRWEMDDYAGNYNQTTIHRIWVREDTTEPLVDWDITKVFGNDEYNFESSASLTSNIYDTGYASDWAALTYNTTLTDAVEVKVRTSNSSTMSGAMNWEACDAVTSGNDISEINSVTDEDRYIQYRVEIDMNGQSESPVFSDITITFAASDQTPPTTNATSVDIEGLRESGDWFNSGPVISWELGEDDSGGKGLEGYCISLNEVLTEGSSELLDPELTAGKLDGLDDGINNTGCPYIISDTTVDFSDITGLELLNDRKYYFSIKAVDLAGNVWTGSSEDYQDLVYFNPKYGLR
jgi:hypothetical protein